MPDTAKGRLDRLELRYRTAIGAVLQARAGLESTLAQLRDDLIAVQGELYEEKNLLSTSDPMHDERHRLTSTSTPGVARRTARILQGLNQDLKGERR